MGNAVGLLHEEMRRLGSLVMAMGDRHKLPAGGALAVDRDGFADAVTAALEAEPLVTLVRAEVGALPPAEPGPRDRRHRAADRPGAGGGHPPGRRPGRSSPSSTRSRRSCTRRRVDLDLAWFQSRYDKEGPGGGTADYLNCPLDREQYEAFIDALLAAEKSDFKAWETLHALFRRLPADRGDGRARARDPALRPDEAGRA